MMISTKGRYALRVLLELAQQGSDGVLSVKTIAERQQISQKYLEAIIALLNRAGMVESHRGKIGGYRLTRPPEAYPVGEILHLTEGSLAPVACLDGEPTACGRADVCLTLPLWKKLDVMIDDYLGSVTLRDLLERKL